MTKKELKLIIKEVIIESNKKKDKNKMRIDKGDIHKKEFSIINRDLNQRRIKGGAHKNKQKDYTRSIRKRKHKNKDIEF